MIDPDDKFDDVDAGLYDEAVKLVYRVGQGSTSVLQRQLKLGFGKACRLLEKMEAEGLIGPSEYNKPRQLLLDPATGLPKPVAAHRRATASELILRLVNAERSVKHVKEDFGNGLGVEAFERILERREQDLANARLDIDQLFKEVGRGQV